MTGENNFELASLIVVLPGINFAFVFASVVEGLEVFWTMQAMISRSPDRPEWPSRDSLFLLSKFREQRPSGK